MRLEDRNQKAEIRRENKEGRRKKTVAYSQLLSFIVIMLMGMTSFGQDVKAKAVLDKLSAKTKAYLTIESEFIYKMENKQASLEMEQNGNIKIKGDKYVLNLGEYKIITDGKTTWTIATEDEEVYIDNNADMEDGGIKPSQFFTIWETGFKNQYAGEGKIGAVACDMIKLFPNNAAEKNYHTIILYVSKTDVEVKQIKMLGKSGEDFTYTIQSIKPNVDLTDNIFTFNPVSNPDLDVIDNR